MPTKLKLNLLLAACWIMSLLLLFSFALIGDPEHTVNGSAAIFWLALSLYIGGMLVPLVLLFRIWSLLDGVKFAIDYRTIIPYLAIPVFGFFWAFKIYASLPKALKVFFQHNGVSKVSNYSGYLKTQGIVFALFLASLGSASFANVADYPNKMIEAVVVISVTLGLVQTLLSFMSVSVLHNLNTSIVKLHVAKFMTSAHQMTESEAEKYRISVSGEKS